MPEVSDAALLWVLVVGGVVAGIVGGLLAFALDRLIQFGSRWTAGRLSGLPVLVAGFGCDDCSVEDGELHRYTGCPGNVRQHEREIGLSADRSSSAGGTS